MKQDEFKIVRITDTLNPDPPKLGMPWYVVLTVLAVSTLALLIPHCRMFGVMLSPIVLGFGKWLTKDDPKEWSLLWYDLLLPEAGYDPGK